MDQLFVDGLNVHSAVERYEISPCLEFPDTDACDSHVEAYATVSEAESQSDEALGPVFYGVYARLRDEVIWDTGAPPALHLQDFSDFDEALGFVTVLNGVPEISYAEGDA